MPLHADAVDPDSLLPKFLSHSQNRLSLLRFPDIVIVVIQFCIRVGRFGFSKCRLDVFRTGDVIPVGFSPRTVIFKGFVDHVPTVDSPFVAAHDSGNMVFHPPDHIGFIQKLSLAVLKNPSRGLLMPNERMTDHKSPESIPECYKSISIIKAIFSLFGVNRPPFEAIFGRDRTEMQSQHRVCPSLLTGDLTQVDCRTDKKVSFKSVFQPNLFLHFAS